MSCTIIIFGIVNCVYCSNYKIQTVPRGTIPYGWKYYEQFNYNITFSQSIFTRNRRFLLISLLYFTCSYFDVQSLPGRQINFRCRREDIDAKTSKHLPCQPPSRSRSENREFFFFCPFIFSRRYSAEWYFADGTLEFRIYLLAIILSTAV